MFRILFGFLAAMPRTSVLARWAGYVPGQPVFVKYQNGWWPAEVKEIHDSGESPGLKVHFHYEDVVYVYIFTNFLTLSPDLMDKVILLDLTCLLKFTDQVVINSFYNGLWGKKDKVIMVI